MADIFDLAYGDAQGYAAIITDLDTEHPSHRWLEWPREANFMRRYAALRADEDVYFTTTLYDHEERRTSEHTTVGQVVYADADTCHPSKFRLAPSAVVETSPGKYHAYWRMTTPLPAATLVELSRLIATAHRADGCDAGWIMTKILRVPGTTNNKHEEPYRIGEPVFNGREYTEEDIREAYKDVVLSEQSVVDVGTEPEDLPDIFTLAERIPEESWDLYATTPPEGAQWHKRLWRLKKDLFREGFTREEVYVVAKNAKCNKWARDGRPEMLWPQVVKCSLEFDQDAVPEEISSTVADKQTRKRKVEKFELLSEEERNAVLDNPTFIDEYADWCMSRSPQSARKYHETMAYILLSSVYGAWGYIAPRYGRQTLNLWALILGPTTNTRKSTSIHRFNEVLHAWEKRNQEVIDIGGDFTVEGLNTLLNERPDKVTFAWRDEFHGFLQEIMQKSFLAGTKQAMTALYDGRLSPKWRAADKKQAAEGKPEHKEVVFNFVGVGIPEEVAGELTAKDIQSGFLPRFLFCVGDPRPWSPEDEVVQQAEDPTVFSRKRTDPAVERFIAQFARGQARWGGDRENFITLSEEANERLTQWHIDTARKTRELDMFDLLHPGRERMGYSIWRAAALLSMHLGEDEISELTLLHVIKQSEDWFTDLVRMANAVSDTEFAGIADQIEAYIIEGEDYRRSLTSVYKKFKDKRKVAVDEYLDNLVAQGRIKRVVENQGKDRYVVALV